MNPTLLGYSIEENVIPASVIVPAVAVAVVIVVDYFCSS